MDRVEVGNAVMYCGDALSILPTLEAGGVDLLVTDPPYGVSLAGDDNVKADGTRRGLDFFAGDSPEASCQLATTAAAMSLPLLAPHASAYWWCGHRQFGHLGRWYESISWKTRFLVWRKLCPCPQHPGSGWPSGAELCLYAFRPGRRWTHATGKGSPRTNVIDADSYRHGQPGKVAHPTQKPLDVFRPLVTASSQPGDTVLDPFMGSGTAGVVSLSLGRRFIGIEKDERYFRIAVDRVRKAWEAEDAVLYRENANGDAPPDLLKTAE